MLRGGEVPGGINVEQRSAGVVKKHLGSLPAFHYWHYLSFELQYETIGVGAI